jgi:Family of unknown function (DUF5843)
MNYSLQIANLCTSPLLPTKKDTTRYLEEKQASGGYPYDLFSSKMPSEVIIGNVYSLNEREYSIAQTLGPKRTEASRAAGMTNMLQCDRRKECFVEVNGLAVELLYGKMFNLFPSEQLEVKARKSIDDYGEYSQCGRRIDTKATEYDNGRLTLGNWKAAAHVDLLALFTNFGGNLDKSQFPWSYVWSPGHQGEFKFRGFYPAKALARPENMGNLPGIEKQQYIMEQGRLLTMDKAIAMLEAMSQPSS